MTSKLLLQFEQAAQKEAQLHQIFRGSVVTKLRHYPWRVLLTKVLFKFIPSLQSRWVVKNRLFTGQTFYTEGYFMDYYLCGIIGEHNEQTLTRWLLHNVHNQEVFYDIGAHYGFYSLVVLAATAGDSSIYAFEPTPSTRAMLRKNTTPFQAIKVIDKAVAEQSGQRLLNMYSSGSKRGSNSFYGPEALAITQSEQQLASVPVLTTTIDEFTTGQKLQPTLIKLDIENAELDALQGGVATLRQYKPKIAMEVWPNPNNTRHHKAAQLLHDLGYKLYALNNQGDLEPIGQLEPWFAAVRKTENLIALP